jgi:hypothetical protein
MGVRAAVLFAGLALLVGCGGDEGGGDSRPAVGELLRDAPAGLTYAEPPAATVSQYRDLLRQSDPDFDESRVAIKNVERDGRMVGQAIVLDGGEQDGRDIAAGFSEGFEERTGKAPEELTLAGTKVTFGENKGRAGAVAHKNGFALEAIGDPPVVKQLIEHLIREADAAG